MASSLLRFFGSLKLAVALLVVLGAVIGTATFLEAHRGRDYAQWCVYGSGWFIALLAALAVNIFAAAITRWPWRRRHAGFVLTHAGLLVLLAGAVQTFLFGTQGQIVLREGEQTSDMLVPKASLIEIVRKSDAGTLTTELTLTPGPTDWPEDRELDFGVNKGLGVKVLKYIRHAREQLEWVADDEIYDGPALHLELADARGQTVADKWLSGNKYGGEAVIGPMMYSLAPIALPSMEQDFLEPPTENWGTAGILSIHHDGAMQRIKVDDHLGKKVAVGDGGMEVEVVEYLPSARPTTDGRFASPAGPAKNPMLELRIHEPGNATPIRQIAFAKRPLLNLDGVHGKATAVKFWYHHPDAKPESGAMFMQTSDGRLFYRTVANGEASAPQQVHEGGQIALVGGFKLAVRRYLPRARQDARFQSVATSPMQKNPPEAAVLLELTVGATKRRAWLKRSDPLYGSYAVSTEQGPMMLSFGPARRPLGYTMRLENFTRTQNPGGVGNASFASVVEVVDPQAEDKQSFEISMNRPLDYGQFTFYQSSFEDAGHGKSASVLNAAYDPGRLLKYSGSIMVCGGIFVMFFMRAYFFANIPRLIGGTVRRQSDASPPLDDKPLDAEPSADDGPSEIERRAA